MTIEKLLRPRAVAIIGASDKVGPGFNAWNSLNRVGFAGEIYLVNPSKSELLGRRCYASVEDIPGQIDAAFVSVQAERILDVAKAAVARGAGGLAILSSGFGEAGDDGAAAQRALVSFAEERGLAVCGPNCLGFLNFSGHTALFGTSLPENIESGGIAAIVQSGSIGIALLNAARGIGLSCLITSGNEAVTTTADYMEALLEDPAVQTFVVFAEQIKSPRKFIDVLRRARTAQKPVIVLKSGRSLRGQEAVLAHTGAVAGNVEATDAALEDAGAIQVRSLDELLEAAVVASNVRTPIKKSGMGVLSLSGGEIALALDANESVGIDLPNPDPVRNELTSLLPAFAHIANPLDLTWAGLYDAEIASACAKVLGSHPEIGGLALLQDAPRGLGDQQAERYSRLLGAVARGAAKAEVPLFAISNLSGEVHPKLRDTAAAHNVPYLRGTHEGLSAIAKYTRWATRKKELAPPKPDAGARAQAADQLRRFNERLPAEDQARDILKAYGVPGLREARVNDVAEALESATAIGYPVVLKGLIDGVIHKSDAGLVEVGLNSQKELHAAVDRLHAAAQRIGKALAGLLVQEKAAPLVELFVGARIDPNFGPILAVGTGGLGVELYRDVAIRLCPVSEETALKAIAETRIGRLLEGYRGKPPADKKAAAMAISAISHFASDFADEVAEVEVNPLAVFAEGAGCSALDCVIVPRKSRPRS